MAVKNPTDTSSGTNTGTGRTSTDMNRRRCLDSCFRTSSFTRHCHCTFGASVTTVKGELKSQDYYGDFLKIYFY